MVGLRAAVEAAEDGPNIAWELEEPEDLLGVREEEEEEEEEEDSNNSMCGQGTGRVSFVDSLGHNVAQ